MASSRSSKKLVPKYIKFIMLQKLSECKRSVNFICGKVWHAIMNIDHLNGLIEMMEVMEFTLEIYDSVWCLKEMVKAENKRLLGLNKHLVDAEEDIRAKEGLSLDEGGLHDLMYFVLMYVYDMPIIDEVVFKIHKKGFFEFHHLRYVNGAVYSVSTFTCNRDIFPTCLDSILSMISKEKWALFYCLPNKQLEHGLKLIHTDNDVHSFFADAELNVRKSRRVLKKKGKAVGRMLIDPCDKGKEKVDDFSAATPTKEHQVVVTNYKRAIVNGKAKNG
uniref:Uncharacterized protein n=1 Tax=Tanacetum cinerariifolium TaxID=118510 RepID=A0A6L2LPH8_TANCI|nr:hypothetical protein [Tanacetum cinerariifolium]